MSGSFRSAETIDDDVKEEKMKLMSDSHTSPFAVVVKVTSSPRAHSIYSFHFFFLNLLNVTAGFIPSRLLPHNPLFVFTSGNFQVAFRLCFKASPSVKPLIWKLVLFTCK